MEESYMYDVFISYRHKSPVRDWFINHFLEQLEQWLPNYMPYEPRIFTDLQIEKGKDFGDVLSKALLVSRCLLTIWCPVYFRSNWCEAELQAMREREQLLNLQINRNPPALIYPVLYCGAKSLPSYVQAIQYKDMSEWNNPYPVFKQTVQYVEFVKQMQELCQDLAVMIQSAPPWQASWPVVTPEIYQTEISQSITFALPRL